jgi:YidC/Oxa1 family membrane protein insertase
MTDQKNLVLAIAISAAILLGFNYFFEAPRQRAIQAETARQKALQEQTVAQAPAAAPGAAPGAAPETPTQATQAPAVQDRPTALGQSPRLSIDTPSLHGSIRLSGARLDDLTLARYRVDPKPDSPEVILLSPTGGPQPYFAEFGWIGAQGGQVRVPDGTTPWQTADQALKPGQPVKLTWDNGQGLTFEREIAVDDKYLFTVTDRVRNSGSDPVTLYPYGLIRRTGTPHTSGYYILHEGPLGVLDGTLQEVKYKDLVSKGRLTFDSTGGWVGITDKYWLVSLIPDQQTKAQVIIQHMTRNGQDEYQTDYRGEAVTLAPGASSETVNRLFAGAKEVRLLDAYQTELGIPRFDRAVDFGWFYFLTKPFFYALDTLAHWFGNFGVAILLFTIVLRGAFFPLANKQFASMAKMKKLQPQMQALKERFKDDPQRFQMEMMGLYKKEKVNPLSGCLPIVIQIPVFFALYKVLFVTIEMRHAPFIGWIRDLSAPDPTSLFNLFGLLPFTPPTFLHIGLLPILMGLTMFAQQKLSPANPDPMQQRVFLMMPIIFTFMMANFPAGLVIYWTWSNLLTITQQWFILRRHSREA